MSAQVTEPDAWFDIGELSEPVRTTADCFDLEPLVAQVTQRCLETVFPGHGHDGEFVARLRASVSQNAYALRDVIAGRRSLDQVALDAVLHFATVQAELRIPQKSMQRSYRVSFFTQWEMWTSQLRRHIEQHELGSEEAADSLSQLTRAILTYQDHVASRVAETYTRDYEALNRSRAHVRRNLVRDLLRGEDGALSASDLVILAYPLEGHHVAVLLPQMPEGAATQLADGLRSATKAHQTLVYPMSLGSTTIWLCKLDPWRPAAMQTVCDVLSRIGAIASVSNPGSGVAGLRSSLTQATETERVRAAWGPQIAPPVIRYADAGLEILLLQDDELARNFVNAELGPLATSSTEAVRLRETLEASFRFGTHVAAADHLKLHEHTVRNRLHKVEELLGHPLHERRTEIQVAIRLLRMLGQPEVD